MTFCRYNACLSPQMLQPKMKLRILACLAFLFSFSSACPARIANPYPVAVIRQGDVYLIEEKDEMKRLTQSGDVHEICWLDQETICFSRKMETGLAFDKNWVGLGTIWDLFTVSKNGGPAHQFTAHHFARGPSPSPMNGRALFWHDGLLTDTQCEIWETIHPKRRDRPLGIQGTTPDASPDRKWTAASLGRESPGGVGLYRYPTDDSYRKLRGPYHRPRFSPDGRLLTYLNYESGKGEIWGYDLPDGEPRRLLGTTPHIKTIADFGWVGDGSGYVLVLEDENGKKDVYFWEIKQESLTKLSETGDVTAATSWH